MFVWYFGASRSQNHWVDNHNRFVCCPLRYHTDTVLAVSSSREFMKFKHSNAQAFEHSSIQAFEGFKFSAKMIQRLKWRTLLFG